MKENVEKKILMITERILRKDALLPGEVWPPNCTVLIHQPKRPIKKSNS